MLSFRKPISELLHVNEINHGCMKIKVRHCLAKFRDRTILQLFDEVGLEELNLITHFFGFVDESTGVLRKAESEYKGHRSLLMRTRNLLSTMQRQDIIDRFD